MILEIEPTGQGNQSETSRNTTRDALGPLNEQASRHVVRKPVDPSLARSNLAALGMAVLLIVAALATVAIILSAGCSDRQAPQVKAAPPSSQTRLSLTAFGEARSRPKRDDAILTHASAVPQAVEKIEDDAKRNASVADTADFSVGP